MTLDIFPYLEVRPGESQEWNDTRIHHLCILQAESRRLSSALSFTQGRTSCLHSEDPAWRWRHSSSKCALEAFHLGCERSETGLFLQSLIHFCSTIKCTPLYSVCRCCLGDPNNVTLKTGRAAQRQDALFMLQGNDASFLLSAWGLGTLAGWQFTGLNSCLSLGKIPVLSHVLRSCHVPGTTRD